MTQTPRTSRTSRPRCARAAWHLHPRPAPSSRSATCTGGWQPRRSSRPTRPSPWRLPSCRAHCPRRCPRTQVLALLDTVEARVALDRDPLALRDLALLEVLYGTGARISEVCGLGFGDVDLDGALVRLFGKRSKERIVPLGRPAIRGAGGVVRRGPPGAGADAAGGPATTPTRSSWVHAGTRLTRQGAWLVLQRCATRGGPRRPRQPARAAPLLRDPPARSGCRHPHRAGAARPRVGQHHADLHAGRHRAALAGLPRCASPVRVRAR